MRLLLALALGEGWHNNHHHFMASARQGFSIVPQVLGTSGFESRLAVHRPEAESGKRYRKDPGFPRKTESKSSRQAEDVPPTMRQLS
jgi:hypothetical protein